MHHGDGPLLVLAGAGSGKTGTLAPRVGHLLDRGVAPERICLLTFSRRARPRCWLGPASAARRRAGLGRHVPRRRPTASSASTAVARRPRSRVHRPRRGRRHRAVRPGPHRPRPRRRAAAAAGDGSPAPTPSPASSTTGWSTPASGCPTSWPAMLPWCAGRRRRASGTCFAAYTARKRAQQRPRLRRPAPVLAGPRRAVPGRAGRGCSTTCWSTSTRTPTPCRPTSSPPSAPTAEGSPSSATTPRPSTASGPPRAATSSTSPTRFPGTTVVRAGAELPLDAAHPRRRQRGHGRGRPRARAMPRCCGRTRPGARRPLLRTCGDEDAEAAAVCDSVLAHRDDGRRPPRAGGAVPGRATTPTCSSCELTRRNIPYVKYGGLRFLEAAHVKDLLALLRRARQPVRRAGLVPGPAAARRRRARPPPAGSWRRSACGRRPATPTATPARPAPGRRARRCRPRPGRSSTGCAAALADCADGCLPGGATPPPAVQVERLRPVAGPDRRAAATTSAAARLADLDQLEGVARRTHPSRGRFVSDLTLDPPSSTGDLAGPPAARRGLADRCPRSTRPRAASGTSCTSSTPATACFPSDMATGDRRGHRGGAPPAVRGRAPGPATCSR